MKSAQHTRATPVLDRMSQADRGGRILHILHPVEALQEAHDDIRHLHEGKLLYQMNRQLHSQPTFVLFVFAFYERTIRIERTSK